MANPKGNPDIIENTRATRFIKGGGTARGPRPSDYMRHFAHMSREELQATADNEAETASKRQAAMDTLDGFDRELAQRDRAAASERVMNRIEGQPKATTETTVITLTAAELLQQAREESQIGGADGETDADDDTERKDAT